MGKLRNPLQRHLWRKQAISCHFADRLASVVIRYHALCVMHCSKSTIGPPRPETIRNGGTMYARQVDVLRITRRLDPVRWNARYGCVIRRPFDVTVIDKIAFAPNPVKASHQSPKDLPQVSEITRSEFSISCAMGTVDSYEVWMFHKTNRAWLGWKKPCCLFKSEKNDAHHFSTAVVG
jgi:hypothetical protein